MRKLLLSTAAAALLGASPVLAQNEFYNDGADVYVQSTGLIFVQGDVINDDGVTPGRMFNSGDIQLTGNWSNTSASTNVFQALDPGTTTFLGTGAVQTIGGTRETIFNNITINKSGGATQEVRQLINSSCDRTLNLTNDFLNTQVFGFVVSNTATNSIQRTGPILPNTYTNSTTVGYVTSTSGSTGRLVRATSATPGLIYLFPVGTAARFRPVEITSSSVATNFYGVQFVDLPTPNPTIKATTLSTINPAWYHFIERALPTAPVNSPETIRIYHDFAADDVCDINRVTMAEWNTLLWADLSVTNSFANVTPILSWTERTNYPVGYPTPWNTNQFALAGLFITPGVSSCVFPVELTQLTATPLENTIMVSWQAQSQMNNDGWFVERSRNGRDFTDIGWRDGAGTTTNTIDYDLEDADVVPSVLYYYRLRQLDLNGGTNYSEIVTAMLPGENLTIGELYPNPSAGLINMPIAVKGDTKLRLGIVNMLGQEVLGRDYRLMDGYQVLTLDLSALAKGVYQVNFQMKGQQISKKLVLE